MLKVFSWRVTRTRGLMGDWGQAVMVLTVRLMSLSFIVLGL